MGVITRAISVAADTTILGITLWKTFYIFRMDKDARGATRLTKTLAYNGTVKDVFLRVRLSLIDSYDRKCSVRVYFILLGSTASNRYIFLESC